jgi:hypothetical protein
VSRTPGVDGTSPSYSHPTYGSALRQSMRCTGECERDGHSDQFAFHVVSFRFAFKIVGVGGATSQTKDSQRLVDVMVICRGKTFLAVM